jgi:hypothetical protein
MLSRSDSNSSEYRAAELGALLARHYPEAPVHLVARVVRQMQAAAKWSVRTEVRRCNYSETEAGESRRLRREAALEHELALVLGSLRLLPDRSSDDREHAAPCRVELGGDPRGPCARLHVPGERGDGFGDGFGIW